MFKIFLIALLMFLNCGSDKTPLAVVETDPTEALWGNWWGTYQNTNEYGHYGIVFVFKHDGIVSCREKWFASSSKAFFEDFAIGDEEENDPDHIFPWFDGIYAYDIAGRLLILSFKDIPGEDISGGGTTAYDGSDSFILWEITFSKQDTLPDWAGEAP